MGAGNWTEETVERMGLPMDALLGASMVQVFSDKAAVIENHRGLVEYTDRLIGIAAPGRTIRIRGQRLAVAAMNRFRIRVTGRIEAVEYL